jgi:hypothetical protein
MAEPYAGLAQQIDVESDTLVISFGGLMGRRPIHEGGRFLSGWPVKRVLVRDLEGVWYQRGVRGVGDSVPEVARELKDLVGRSEAARVITTGGSAGGFGALLFGALIEADLTVVFSAQSVIDPKMREELGDRRWGTSVDRLVELCGEAPPHGDVIPAIESRERPGAVEMHYAEDEPLDVEHAERLAHLEGVELHPREKGGHHLARRLQRSGEYAQILKRAMQAEPLPKSRDKRAGPVERRLQPAEVDVVVFAPERSDRLAATVASLEAAGPRSVQAVSAEPAPRGAAANVRLHDRHASFMGLHKAVAAAMDAGDGRGVMLAYAGLEFPEGFLTPLLQGRHRGKQPTLLAAVELTGSGTKESAGRAPGKLPELLAAPYTPHGFVVPRNAYEEAGGLDPALGPLMVWDLLIRLAALHRDQRLEAWSDAIWSEPPVDRHEAQFLRFLTSGRGVAPDAAAELASDMGRYLRDTVWEVLRRNRELIQEYAVESLVAARAPAGGQRPRLIKPLDRGDRPSSDAQLDPVRK